jgi:hypothetical protein
MLNISETSGKENECNNSLFTLSHKEKVDLFDDIEDNEFFLKIEPYEYTKLTEKEVNSHFQNDVEKISQYENCYKNDTNAQNEVRPLLNDHGKCNFLSFSSFS